ncbi:hypothetical protein EV363DRAFT_1337278 [Boletus edulis]|nr:hypothetical protein EV363DRAFT_1337278 [Boletus edulis]
MTSTGIPLDEAELLSVLLEALLYGFSLLMFGVTIWTLVCRRSADHVNRKMFTASCLLLLGSTIHFIIDIIRTMEGLILYRNTYPGGPIAYFADASHWTFVYKGYVFTAQTLIGDSVVLYRCYVVWQSKLVMILPALLWCSTLVTGIACPYTASRVTQSEGFGETLSRWITAFWVTALATNLLTTLMLVYRIWHLDRRATTLHSDQRYQLRPILHTVLDAGVIYTATLLTALFCFLSQSNGQFVVLNMVTPIISITFYMVIILVGRAARKSLTNRPLRDTSAHDMINVEQSRGTQVHITKLTECKVDHVACSGCQARPTASSENVQSQTTHDDEASFDAV